VSYRLNPNLDPLIRLGHRRRSLHSDYHVNTRRIGGANQVAKVDVVSAARVISIWRHYDIGGRLDATRSVHWFFSIPDVRAPPFGPPMLVTRDPSRSLGSQGSAGWDYEISFL